MYTPLEIQEEILKRLSVKPLIQFRSVSKPWKGLIDSPDFIASYGVRHPHPDRFILRYELPLYSDIIAVHGDDKYITLVDNDDDNSFVQQDFVPTIPGLIKKFEPDTVNVGSSHGLLCFTGCYVYGDFFNRHREKMAVIWNPSLRKSVGIQVPDIDHYHDMPIEYLYCINSCSVFGFGVCPVTLDPTILKIEHVEYKHEMELISVHWKVGVFTLSTGAWSILSTNLPRESIELGDHQVVIDRFIYWVAFDKLGAGLPESDYLIISFNLTTKEFKEINLSGSLSNQVFKIRSLSKLRESLVVLAYHGTVREEVFSLWMMKEQGVNRSFTKLYNINMLHHDSINTLLGFGNTGELILERRGLNADVQIYDPNLEAIDNLGIVGKPYSFFMWSYMETLLLFGQLDGFIYSIVTDHK